MVTRKKAPVDASEVVARQRLEILKLADRLGNAAEACRRSRVDRTSFYQWKRRFAREGLAGLRNRSPVHRSHPHATPADVSRRILSLALKYPAYGCDRIESALATVGIDLSAVTIQKILHQGGLGTQATRAAALEARYAESKKLSARQLEFLESVNPCLRERTAETARPGELLVLGSFFLGSFEGLGSLYVHAAVDCYSSYAFGSLATGTRIEPAIDILRNAALPFFQRRGIVVDAVLSGPLSETSDTVLRQYLRAQDIVHRTSGDRIANGFLERFRRETIGEFLPTPLLRRISRPGIGFFQREFAGWLLAYNETRAHDGYRNYGATPASVVNATSQKR